MRWFPVAIAMLLPLTPARAQVSVGIDIGFSVPVYPELVPVPGYPVYYAPAASTNYFFYDGLYWVFVNDGWYASDWYDGPWRPVGPAYVPVYLLRVPVRYYHAPPPYFRAWGPDAPPRWGERYGPGWERRRAGWDHWDRHAVPRPAPLPLYQRQYSGDRYPRSMDQQHAIRTESYRYRPREAMVRRQYQQPGDRGGPRAEPQRQGPDHWRGQAEPPRGQPGRQQPWHDQRQQPARQQPWPEGHPQQVRQQPWPEQGHPQQPRQQQPGPRGQAPQPQRQGAEQQDPRRGAPAAQRSGGRDERDEGHGPPRR